MTSLPPVSKRWYALGVLAFVLALVSRRRSRWFAGVGLTALGAGWLWSRRRRLLPPLPLLAGEELPASGGVVDVGARDPRWLARVAAKVAPRSLHAVSGVVPAGAEQWLDRMEQGLRQAKLEQVAPVVADAGHLPFPDDQTALVVMHDLFERLPDRGTRQRAIGEAVRILAPGGRLVVENSPWASDVAAAMAGQGLGVRRAEAFGAIWLTGTKPWA